MIKINLASRKQASAVADRGGVGALGVLTGFLKKGGGGSTGQLDSLKDLPLRKIALMAAVGVAAYYLAEDFKEQELLKVDTLLTKVTAEKAKLKGELQRTQQLEAMKKQLEADETILRGKLESVEKLIADRQAPAKMLVSLSSATPKDVWLREFKIDAGKVSFTGSALGFNQVSDFMKNLSENAYFTDLRFEKTEQGKDERGTAVATFEIQAKRR